MADIAIQAENISKQYRLGGGTAAFRRTLHEVIADSVGGAARRLTGRSNGKVKPGKQTPPERFFWALKGLSFDVHQGQIVGIMGRNGAGKSTLLKILSRITDPTEGRAEVFGRVGSLLEVGTGFHQELTGRENIYLNGTILGMRHAEIRAKLDQIIAFSEIERFIDTPVKRYSSGMFVRLAFAVAAHLEPEIMIVDEVLAVGDATFQAKCLGKTQDMARGGRTVLFVSHNLAAVQTLCTRGIVLEAGRMIKSGSARECIDFYISQGGSGPQATWSRGEHQKAAPLEFRRISGDLLGDQPSQTLKLRMELQTTENHRPAMLDVDIHNSVGEVIMQAQPGCTPFIDPARGSHVIEMEIRLPPLIPGSYSLSTRVGAHVGDTFDHVHRCVSFEVHESPVPGRTYPHNHDHGYVVPVSSIQYH